MTTSPVKKKLETRTDQNEQREQTINQSERSRPNKPKPKENKANKRSSSLPHSNTVDTIKLNAIQTVQEITMDIRRIKQIEKETLNLTKRWKEPVKPGEYRTSNGVWKKYNPPRHHRAEIKRIEKTLNKRRNRMLWDRMEEQDGEAEEETERRNELYRVIEKIPKLLRKQEIQLETSSETQEQEESPEVETESTSSIEFLGVSAINFKKYIGATGVRYIQMGQASHIQEENKWDLKETIRQAEQKFATDLRTIAKETTEDEKLLKTLVCLERRTLEQIPEECKAYQRQLSMRFGVVFYDDRIIIPKSLRTTIIMLLHKGHAAINKMTAAAKPFWWLRLVRDIQLKCDE